MYKVGLYKVGSLPVRNLSGDGATQNTKLNTDALITILDGMHDISMFFLFIQEGDFFLIVISSLSGGCLVTLNEFESSSTHHKPCF